MKRYLMILALTASGLAAIGQDIHFSQFNSAPILLNPALTGVNACNYRLAANYKTQWTKLAFYNTIAASYDMSMFKHSTKSNFAGIGVSFFRDQAGDSKFTTTQVNLSLAYTATLNRKGTQFLSSGIFGGIGYRSIDYSKLSFDSQYGVDGYDPNRSSQENFATNNILYGDIGAGALWNYNRKKSNYYLGFSASHLTQPNLSFMNANDEKLYIKFTTHGGGLFEVSKQIALLPSFMILNQGPHNEYNIGTLVKIRKSLLPSDKTSFYIGGWYRVLDALILNARVDVAGFNIGFSYDINLSKLTPASNANGGAELSLIYTGCWPNKKDQVKFCPAL